MSWDYKQVIVVRKDLNLSPGKMAAQVAHAAISALDDISLSVRDRWYADGKHQKKVVLEVADEDGLIEVMELCEVMGIPYAMIMDAGRTEIKSGTLTCVGIGPHNNELMDQITGHLKTYR